MKMNEGPIDRLVRVLAGILLIALAFFGVVSGAWMYIFYALGGILLVTGIAGFCPLYRLFKFSTVKNK